MPKDSRHVIKMELWCFLDCPYSLTILFRIALFHSMWQCMSGLLLPKRQNARKIFLSVQYQFMIAIRFLILEATKNAFEPLLPLLFHAVFGLMKHSLIFWAIVRASPVVCHYKCKEGEWQNVLSFLVQSSYFLWRNTASTAITTYHSSNHVFQRMKTFESGKRFGTIRSFHVLWFLTQWRMRSIAL